LSVVQPAKQQQIIGNLADIMIITTATAASSRQPLRARWKTKEKDAKNEPNWTQRALNVLIEVKVKQNRKNKTRRITPLWSKPGGKYTTRWGKNL